MRRLMPRPASLFDAVGSKARHRRAVPHSIAGKTRLTIQARPQVVRLTKWPVYDPTGPGKPTHCVRGRVSSRGRLQYQAASLMCQPGQ